MTRSAIPEPGSGSDLSKVQFQIDDGKNRFPNLQETQATQQALTDLGTGLSGQDNLANKDDPNQIALRFKEFDLYLQMIQTIEKAWEETHKKCEDCLPK